MLLKVSLDVKFRAFFITFARFTRQWTLPLPIPVPNVIPTSTLLHFDQQGVKLDVGLN